jgi:outer membrane autotransporter protein
LFWGGVSPGSQNSWFLRSSLLPTGGAPIPLYRPEVAVQSAVPSTALTLALVSVGTFNERQGDQLLLRGDRAPGVWGRVFGQQTREHFAQGAQPEFYGTYAGFQAGRDFLQFATADGHTSHAGLYIAYSRASGDVNGHVDGVKGTSAGHLDLEANSVGGYWTHIGPSNWYIDAVLQGSFVNGTTTSDRQLSTGNYARAVTASIEGGYPVLLAPWLALEPQAQLIWQRLWINNAVDSISPIAFSQPEALTGRVGTLLRGTFGGPAAIWQPYLKGNVWFGGNGTDLVTFATTPVPVQRNHGTALEGGGGITGKLTQSISVYADASYLSSVSGEQWIALKGNVGLRVTW